MREAPDWRAFSDRNVEVENLKHVGDILRQDVHAVLPETPIDEVIRIIDDNDLQRVVVVDDGSSDGTYEQSLAGGALAVRSPVNRGGGAALRLGYDILKEAETLGT